jgi:hypothetical protein
MHPITIKIRQRLTAVALAIGCVLVSACATTEGTRPDTTPSAMARPDKYKCGNANGAFQLDLEIEQNANLDPIAIQCNSPDPADCASTGPSPHPKVDRTKWIRWSLVSGADTPFYVIFSADESPANPGKQPGPGMAASSKGELCMKINGSASSDEYHYSVFVKHCDPGNVSCRPEVLDPIIYVRN